MSDDTVIFDVDGTLVDTNYHHAIAWFQAFQRHGVTVPVWRVHRAIGMGGDRLVTHVAGADLEDELGRRPARGVEAGLRADAPAGARLRRGAGLPCVALLTGGFAEAELREAGATAIFADLPSLRDALDELPFSSR